MINRYGYYGAIIAAILLAAYLCIQPLLFKLQVHFGIPHPSVLWLVVVGIFQLGVVRHLLSPGFSKGVSPTDFALFCFATYVFFRMGIYPDTARHDIVLFISSCVVYCLARLLPGRTLAWFATTVLAIGAVSLLPVVTDLMIAFDVTSEDERVVLLDNITSTQWPSVFLGYVGIWALACAIIRPAKKAHAICLALAAALTLWIPVICGARSVSIIVGTVMLSMLLLPSVRAQWKIWLLAVFVWSLSFMHLPERRAEFYAQIGTAKQKISQIVQQPEAQKLMNDEASNVEYANNVCVVKGNSVLIRKIMYGDAIGVFRQYPWFGVGPGQFGKFSCAFGFGKIHGDPHSVLLAIAAELGLLGLALYGIIVGWVMYHSAQLLWRNHASWQETGLVLVWGYQLMYDQLNGSYLTNIAFMLLTGLLVSVLINRRSMPV